MCTHCWDAIQSDQGNGFPLEQEGPSDRYLRWEAQAQADEDQRQAEEQWEEHKASQEEEQWLQQFICTGCGTHEGELSEGEVIDRKCPQCRIAALPKSIPLESDNDHSDEYSGCPIGEYDLAWTMLAGLTLFFIAAGLMALYATQLN